MSANKGEVIDSQLLAENIGFLDSCFDNSFVLQSSLMTVKEYAEELNDYNTLKVQGNQLSKKNNTSLHQSFALNNSTDPCNTHSTSYFVKSETNVNKNLKEWGLPSEIAKKYELKGVTEMFDWQVSCLSNPKVLLDSSNLVYSAPTSAGKTLIAEIITIKTILERQKKVILILPFVSIVREKMFYLQDILSTSGIRVEGFMGAQSPPGGMQSVHVAICTIEKANSLVNRLLDDGNISELGAVIVDELHLLGDPHRGYILELLLTKIKYITSKLGVQIQIVGMSATLPNLDVLACWLGAELYVTQFRPIPLDEFCLVGNTYYDKQGKSVNKMENTIIDDCDNVLKICLSTIQDGCSVLIFCMTKNRCENLAQNIATSFYKFGCAGCDLGLMLRKELKSEKIFEVLEQLKNCPVGLDQLIKNSVSFGVAYHHAGLTFDERDIIEGGFKSGAIRVLVATSTLSSGVNLPARKVIVRTPVFQKQPINILTYKQMIGRAGRMGRDTKGESILICTEAEKKIGFNLMMGTLDPVRSCIENEDKYMRAVLEMIASQAANTLDELESYSQCTLLFAQKTNESSQNMLLENTLQELQNFELVRIQTDEEVKQYVATHLGKACLSSSMAPNDGLSLFCELQKARQCLVLETDLHLIYLVTPYSVSSQWGDIDWLHLLTLWESLTKAMKRVGELVGVQESFIIRCLRGGNKQNNNVQNKLNIHKRFYTALALQDLVNEVPLSEVANKFQCARGFLQSLQQAAATFAGMVTAFCNQLKWKNMEMLISQFQDRLHFGIHSELLELMKLPSLNGIRARTLFDSGFETVSSIASADINMIENALHKAVPFQSEKEREGDDSDDIRKRNKMKRIWITGCCGMTTKEAAESIIVQARKYLEHEIGVTEIKWNTPAKVTLPDKAEIINGENLESASLSGQIKVELGANTLAETLDGISVGLPKESKDDIDVLQIRNTCESFHEIQNCVENTRTPFPEMEIKKESKESSTCSNVKACDTDKFISATEIENNPSITKSNIIWDSLTISETAIENVTKNRVSDNFFSPNISFGESEENVVVLKETSIKTEYEKNANSKSAKDISLFSSDGDNSSLFEESLVASSKSHDDYIEFKTDKQSDTNFISINSNTIINEFRFTDIEEDKENDLRLVYDDDTKSDNELETGFNLSEDIEVIESQNIKALSVVNELKISFKRHIQSTSRDVLQPLTKKVKTGSNSHNQLDTVPASKEIKLMNINSKEFILQFTNHKITCYVLRGEDICNNLQILDKISYCAIYLDTEKYLDKIVYTDRIIGSNIFKSSDKTIVTIPIIKGIAIYAHDRCLYLDLKSYIQDFLTIQSKLSCWLQKIKQLTVASFRFDYLNIKKAFAIELSLSCVEILLSEWLIDSEERIPSIDYLIKKYCSIDLNNGENKIKNFDNVQSTCFRAWAVWFISMKQFESLKLHENIDNVMKNEIQVLKILADSEYYGVAVDRDLASQLSTDVKSSLEILEKRAYKICGYRFNFNSSRNVAKVLGMYKGRKVSTKKSVLTSHDSPMASIIIYWRKLNTILSKMLCPVMIYQKHCRYSGDNRVKPRYSMHTCTGRVTMLEPNLQNVPRTFSIPVNYLNENESWEEVMEFNCRNIFRATPGMVLVSADYCQLEMRILTHYSDDEVLTRIMRSDVDVFKSIAASWGGVREDEVDDDLRQKAKQLCYGIFYGMGNKSLAQVLDVTELEAAEFMDTFYKTYPAIKTFTQIVVADCKRKGYVETLMKRRRYLPDISSKLSRKKSTAQRQAVNTTIQGSAADIAKAAMCAVEVKTHSLIRLILQMHDELIYEVPEENKHTFMRILKEAMENTVHLKVPLPVKVMSGYTWGSLEEVKLS